MNFPRKKIVHNSCKAAGSSPSSNHAVISIHNPPKQLWYHTAHIIDKIGMPGAVNLVVKKYAELMEWPFLFNEEYYFARVAKIGA